MTVGRKLITCSDRQKAAHEFPDYINIFLPSDSVFFDFVDDRLPEQVLKSLVFHIARKPRHLITHIQRIYHCYYVNLSEQLFAALVDFLVVLDRRGTKISRRMISGTKSKLSREQYRLLQAFMIDQGDTARLIGNQYCIFTKGLMGNQNLVHQVVVSSEQTHDPLDLARDYVEYSQLAEAKEVLEKAVIDDPGRLELHQGLLELYQSTQDVSGLKKMTELFVCLNIAMPDGWNGLMTLFMSGDNER